MKKLLIYYFLSLFFLLTIFCSGVVDSQDGFQYLAVARNIYYKGKPLAPPYEFNTRKNIHMTVLSGKDGDSYGLTGLGFSLALVPAVAAVDIVYKIYHVSPPVHFPLENDWLILLMASFTNAFFGALLGVILLKYFSLLGLNNRQAFLMSLVSIFTTNLFVYTKHINAHMMFIAFVVLSFYFIKKSSYGTHRYAPLLLSGLFLGIAAITYNLTFLLPMSALLVYYLLVNKSSLNTFFSKKIILDLSVFFIGFLPGLLIYLWFENLRSMNSVNIASTAFIMDYGHNRLLKVPISVLFEGIYGQLFSPGRSIFIYSPLLLVIIFFWHKIKPWMKPELIAFLLLSIIYVLFYGAQYSIGASDQGISTLWHGESSWGPRYILPLVPFGMLIVGYIYFQLKRLQKLLVFLPLLIIGLYIEILGILMPYQTKYANLEDKFLLNGTEYRVYLYSNLLPRYTPILNMSKSLIKLAHNFPNTYKHGIYNTKFYDGIDLPFNVGPERWRVVENKGYISFDDNQKNPIRDLTFGVINHPISQSSESVKLQFVLNGKPLLEKPFILSIRERELIKVSVPKDILIPYGNNLVIQVNYDRPVEINFPFNDKVLMEGKQILGFLSFDINGQRQNLESIDVPYVSQLGPKIAGISYQNWGGINQDPWRLWDLHTQTFERIPDFWWIRNLYYWDIPKSWILIPFSINMFGLVFFGYKLIKVYKSK